VFIDCKIARRASRNRESDNLSDHFCFVIFLPVVEGTEFSKIIVNFFPEHGAAVFSSSAPGSRRVSRAANPGTRN